MTTVNDLHPKAMDLAEEAFLLQRQGLYDAAHALFIQALDLEANAAMLLAPTEETEPSRSILFRSAASLAYNAQDYRQAERLIGNGLAGFPPPEILEELKNLYEDINFSHHLKVQGITLSRNQWVMAIHGNATSYGGTLVDPLLLRVEKVKTLFYRTIERLLGVAYRTTSNIDRQIKDTYGLYIKAFVPSSFAVAFQIGAPDPQMLLFEGDEPRKPIEPELVIDELMKCLELWENNRQEVLRELIPDETYYQNFVGIVKQLAPDGDDVRMVGFKAVGERGERPVVLRTSRAQIRNLLKPPVSLQYQPDRLVLNGVLRFASSPPTKSYGTVRLLSPTQAGPLSIKVPIALMKDVVQPYFEELVTISAHRKGKSLYLDDIDFYKPQDQDM